MSQTVMPDADGRDYLIGPFRLSVQRQELLRDGAAVPLSSRAFAALCLLVERPGALVTKQQLFETVWPRMVVEESNLTVAISGLRRALGCGVGEARYVATVPGRGYRFVAAVARDPGPPGAAEPAPLPPGREPLRLPRPVGTLVGRERDVKRVLECLDEHDLVTLTGVGGVGKTRLALAVGEALASRFEDGVGFVELGTLAAPELVAETIAAAFGLQITAEGAAAGTVAAFLRHKSLLLILDNCEHLIDAVARLAGEILTASAGVKILATSRERLRTTGEKVYLLAPLGVPAQDAGLEAGQAMEHGAVRLFVERARLVLDDFAVSDASAPIIAEICRRLDGIPLALELAASRLDVLSPEELLERLAERFRLLARGNRTAPGRQQTLRAMIGWSYDHLPEPERTLLRRLAVFGGSFTVSAAGAVVGGDGWSTFDLLASLVDKSLVMRMTDPAAAVSRYRLLESTRAFGLEQLEDAGEVEACLRRLALFLTDLYTEAEAAWPSTPNGAWRALVEPDLDNLRVALGWALGPDGDAPVGLALVARTIGVWVELSLHRERTRWFTLAGALVTPETPPGIAARILLGPAFIGSYGQTRTLVPAEQAAALLRDTGEPYWLALALSHAAAALTRPGDHASASRYLDEAEAILRSLGPSRQLSTVLRSQGVLRSLDGDLAAARALTEEALAMARDLGLGAGVEAASILLAEWDFAAGNLTAAISRIREVYALTRASGPAAIALSAANNLAGYLLAAGETKAAQLAAREAARLSRAAGDDFTLVIALEHLALAAARVGHPSLAARLAGHGEAYYRANGLERDVTEAATWHALRTALAEALEPTALAALEAEGAAWTHAEAADAVVADEGSVTLG